MRNTLRLCVLGCAVLIACIGVACAPVATPTPTPTLAIVLPPPHPYRHTAGGRSSIYLCSSNSTDSLERN